MSPLTPGAIKLLTKLASFPLPDDIHPMEARWRMFSAYLLDLHKSTSHDALQELRKNVYWAINGPEHGACTKEQAEACKLKVEAWFRERNITP